MGRSRPWSSRSVSDSSPRAAGKELLIGKVQANDRDGQIVLVQPHRARWLYVKIIHEPLYQEREGQTTKPTGKEAVDSVRYEALVKAVSLLKDGELTPGDARDLLKRGWGLRLYQRSEESIAAIAQGAIGVPATMRAALPTTKFRTSSGSRPLLRRHHCQRLWTRSRGGSTKGSRFSRPSRRSSRVQADPTALVPFRLPVPTGLCRSCEEDARTGFRWTRVGSGRRRRQSVKIGGCGSST